MNGIKLRLNLKYDRAAGKAFAKARKNRQLSMSEVARQLGVSTSYVRARELGDMEISLAFTYQYAAILDVNPTTLLRMVKHAYNN